MENNESNLRPQPTGGLKIMTVFVAVLALHVLVLGSFAIYSLLKKSNIDTDVAFDKSHKDAKIVSDTTMPGDVASPDAAATDKTANATTPTSPSDSTADANTTPPATTEMSATPAANSDTATASTAASDTLQPRPAPAPLMVTPPPAADDASSIASSGPTSQTPSGPIQRGPVINPPDNLAPPADASSTAVTAPIDGATPVADGTPYMVKKGDSLARIAHRHHVALAQLKTANSLTSDRLSIGQKLVIPNRAEKLAAADASETASAPQMSSSDTGDSTTAPAISTPSLASTGAKPAHLHMHKTSAADSSHHLYTVVRGDTLMKIARRFRTTAGALMAANNITNASRLSIGKRLRIPSGNSRNAAASVRNATPSERETRTAAHGQLANYVP